MAQHGMLREYRFTEASEDIRGSKLYGGNDEKLGKIDDVIFETTRDSFGTGWSIVAVDCQPGNLSFPWIDCERRRTTTTILRSI